MDFQRHNESETERLRRCGDSILTFFFLSFAPKNPGYRVIDGQADGQMDDCTEGWIDGRIFFLSLTGKRENMGFQMSSSIVRYESFL